MEQIVTGCYDCPFFDSADGEFDRWCNHPKRVFNVFEKVVVNGRLEAKFCEGELKDMLIAKHFEEREQNMIYLDGNNYIVSNMPIKSEEKENAPDWCPLNKEQITIIKKQA